jgi:hypothetical protein
MKDQVVVDVKADGFSVGRPEGMSDVLIVARRNIQVGTCMEGYG